jgi:hypothetical protein
MLLSVSELELDLLRSLPDEMRTVLLTSDDDPARARLFPHAYSDPLAEAEDAEWRETVYPDLVDQRFEALDVIAGTLDRAVVSGRDAEWREITLTGNEVQAWLAVLNDIRLVLGTRLEVTDEHDGVAEDDPNAAAWEFYDWLTHLQGSLVETLLGDFDESDLFDEDQFDD